MKVSVPVMIQDPSFKGPHKEDTEIFENDIFLCYHDGPITDRVAIVDFDPRTGDLVPGTPLVAPKGRAKTWHYKVKDPKKLTAADFCQCTTFGVVGATIKIFEAADVLGRKVQWAFGRPQLLVVPRAGEWANAFYQRETGSLQFFYFKSAEDPKKTVYTCLSRDIVAHEMGHAVLDGVCPWLYNAISPQSLALHEGIADLTALIVSFRNRKLGTMVLKRTKGSIEKSSAFSAVAEQFGAESNPDGVGYLRNLKNDAVLDENTRHSDPHDLCNVLTGAIYSVTLRVYEMIKKEEIENTGRDSLDVWLKSLYLTHQRIARMLFRALDYLPPGEISFADYGRAILAADSATHTKHSPERDWLKQEFVKRSIVGSEQDLDVKTNYKEAGLDVDLTRLIESEFAAYSFAEKNRELLGIPDGMPFEVHPRLNVMKTYYVGDGKTKQVRECIFKVSWQYDKEKNPSIASFPTHRRFTVGTTLALDWEETQKLQQEGTGEMYVRAKLTIAPDHRTKRQRDEFLKRLVQGGFLLPAGKCPSLDGNVSKCSVSMEVADGLLRIRGTLRALHLVGGKS